MGAVNASTGRGSPWPRMNRISCLETSRPRTRLFPRRAQRCHMQQPRWLRMRLGTWGGRGRWDRLRRWCRCRRFGGWYRCGFRFGGRRRRFGRWRGCRCRCGFRFDSRWRCFDRCRRFGRRRRGRCWRGFRFNSRRRRFNGYRWRGRLRELQFADRGEIGRNRCLAQGNWFARKAATGDGVYRSYDDQQDDTANDDFGVIVFFNPQHGFQLSESRYFFHRVNPLVRMSSGKISFQ